MTRIIVHAGFHKTGTTSLQDFLAQNRAALKPHFDYYGKADFLNAGTRARQYSQRPFPWRRLHFRRAFRRFLASVPDAGVIVMSQETFSGVMPGHRDVFRRLIAGHRHAIPLARIIIDELGRRFGPDAEIQFLYTTRTQTPWLRSVYGHLLRSIQLADDFETFRAGFVNLPDPEIDAQNIATALAPIPVFIARLEDFADHPEGTAAALLDLAGVADEDRSDLRPARRQNPGQSPEIEQQFLALNRSGQSRAALKSQKDTILKTSSAP